MTKAGQSSNGPRQVLEGEIVRSGAAINGPLLEHAEVVITKKLHCVVQWAAVLPERSLISTETALIHWWA